MAGEWSQVQVADLGHVATGRTPPGNDPAYYDGDVPFLTPSDMVECRRVERTARSLSPYGEKQLARCLIPHGVGVSCIGWQMGKAVLIDRPTVTNQQINSVIVSESVADSSFVYYSFTARRSELFNLGAGGSRTPILNKGDFKRLPFMLPALDEQRAIAHILGTLDDKIELNRRMNETLEAMARALFKSWFVDFDPVRAKAEGHDPGLPQPLADLFPARLVDSDLGKIPEGWEVGTFGDVVEQHRDNENPLTSPDTRFRHFSIPAFDEGQWPKQEFGESIKSQKSRVPPGVVLLSKLNPEIERVWLVDVQAEDRAVCSTEFVVLRPRAPHGRSYAYCVARSPVFRQGIEGLVTGTSKSHQRAQTGSILGLNVVRPPDSLLHLLERAAESLLKRTLECRRESVTLAALRDTLLPKLISGELRIQDNERIIEVAP